MSQDSYYLEDLSDENTREIYLNALEQLKDASETSPINTSKLIAGISGGLENSPKEHIIYFTLLDASKSSKSRIRSRKGRTGGYFLVEPDVLKEDQPRDSSISRDLVQDQSASDKTLEKHLWPLITYWLKRQKNLGHASHEYANLKSGGKWGNPDVLALDPLDRLGFFNVEVTSVEVKPSMSNWEYYFFEAVSHKRFAERSYYAFRYDEAKAEQLSSLLDYAEKFGVGLLKIELDDAQFTAMTAWDEMAEVDKLQLVDQVVEVIPAPFQAVNLSEKVNFLERVGIKYKEQIYQFGTKK